MNMKLNILRCPYVRPTVSLVCLESPCKMNIGTHTKNGEKDIADVIGNSISPIF